MASETLGAPVRLLRYHQADGREPMWSQLICRSVYRRPTTLGKKNQEKRLEHAKAVKFDVYWSGGKAVRGEKRGTFLCLSSTSVTHIGPTKIARADWSHFYQHAIDCMLRLHTFWWRPRGELARHIPSCHDYFPVRTTYTGSTQTLHWAGFSAALYLAIEEKMSQQHYLLRRRRLWAQL